MRFDPRYFQKIQLTPQEVDLYWQNAHRDLKIATKDPYPEARFQFAYQALLKAGITVIAKRNQWKVRSTAGHHIQVLKAFSELMKDKDIFVMGNAMRQKRNHDLYRGGEYISQKEADEYVAFVSKVMQRVDKEIMGKVQPL